MYCFEPFMGYEQNWKEVETFDKTQVCIMYPISNTILGGKMLYSM